MGTSKSKILRAATLAERSALLPEDRGVKSRLVCAKLLDMEVVRKAVTIFVYMDFRSEVKTMEFINQCLGLEKIITVPVTLEQDHRLLAVQITDPKNDIVPGYCDIPEPTEELARSSVRDSTEIDVVIVPGSVFDRLGGRLGYGGGYYDRFLEHDAPRALRIGLAFEVQLVEKVPVLPHDQFMDMVVTEEKIYHCRRTRNAQDSSLSR